MKKEKSMLFFPKTCVIPNKHKEVTAWVVLKVMSPIYFHVSTADTKSTVALFVRVNSQLKTPLFNIVTTISCAFWPVMNMSLRATHHKILQQ